MSQNFRNRSTDMENQFHSINLILNETDELIRNQNLFSSQILQNSSMSELEEDFDNVIENEEEEEEVEVCSICLESITNNSSVIILECSHSFHFNCILQNSISNNNQFVDSCPNCRVNITETRLIKNIINETNTLKTECIYHLENIKKMMEEKNHHRDLAHKYKLKYLEEQNKSNKLMDVITQIQYQTDMARFV